MKRHTAVSLAATFTLLCCSILPVGAYDMGSPEEPLRLSAGLSHTVYVDETGTLWAWGSNQAGQLGTETQETSTDLEGNPIPYASQPLAVMEGVVSASAGADFTVALKADGTLWTWGGNDEGQLGTGTTEGSTTPVQVLDQVTAVVAGDYHVAALRTDGTLWMWGSNIDGQLGTGQATEVLQTQPVQVPLNGAVLAVAAGTGHTVAILEDGSLWVWGRNDQGQLGLDPDTAALVPQPTQVTEATGAVDVAAGTYQTACLLSDGTLLTWGAQRLLGSGSVEAWAETATEDTTAQVTLSQEAGWAPWAVLAGSVVCLPAWSPAPAGIEFRFFPKFRVSLYFCIKREYTCLHNLANQWEVSAMELFRPAGLLQADPDSRDWTRDHGYAQVSSFPFPPLYLGDDLAQLAEEDPDLAPFLHQCLLQFVNHEYGHLSSLDLVENFLNRDVHQKSTWMRGNYPSPRWGEIRLEIFYDMGLFHREDTAPRALALEQSRKEKATRPEENP